MKCCYWVLNLPTDDAGAGEISAPFFFTLFICNMLIQTDSAFELATAFIHATGANVLLTGKAGTGKTTLLKHICANSLKQTAVVAPTGVAAINAAGSTIHSFFGLPFQPFVPTPQSRHDLMSNVKLSLEKRQVIQNIELLIIDEISMVRCDILDSIDVILRSVRAKPHFPFGGVQLLLIGDMYQLPPVVKPAEWMMMKNYYASPYFFSSQVMQQFPPVYIELDVVYRQKDAAFINLLNQVRNNEMDEEHDELLHSRLRINHAVDTEDLITLTTHNEYADTMNQSALKKIDSKLFSFRAKVEGNFQQGNFPADETLELKIGAKVMFIKNDIERIKRYYNGKTGIVKKIEEDTIYVEVDGATEIAVKKETWKNIRYSVEKKSGKIMEEELGSFIQFPLRLAWAITIHKSQGLTFDKVLIDAASAFAPGQIYVALSRCRTLDGIYLTRRIATKSLASDPAIVQFANAQKNNDHAAAILQEEAFRYQRDTLLSVFKLEKIYEQLHHFLSWSRMQEGIEKTGTPWIEEVLDQFSIFHTTSNKFVNSIVPMFDSGNTITPLLQERVKAAVNYFTPLLQNLMEVIISCKISSDNIKVAGDFSEKINSIYKNLHVHAFQMHICKDGFSMIEFQKKKKEYVIPADVVNAYENTGSYSDPSELKNELYQILINKRNQLATLHNRSRYLIISTTAIQDMSQLLPTTLDQLKNISGFGPIKLRQYGNDFLNLINEFCAKYNMASTISDIPVIHREKEKTDKTKTHTRIKSFELFTQGKSVAEIAAERNLTTGTIESHLNDFINSGQLSITDLIEEKKLGQIMSAMNEHPTEKLSEIKERLPECSFGELRWVITYRKLTVDNT